MIVLSSWIHSFGWQSSDADVDCGVWMHDARGAHSFHPPKQKDSTLQIECSKCNQYAQKYPRHKQTSIDDLFTTERWVAMDGIKTTSY